MWRNGFLKLKITATRKFSFFWLEIKRIWKSFVNLLKIFIASIFYQEGSFFRRRIKTSGIEWFAIYWNISKKWRKCWTSIWNCHCQCIKKNRIGGNQSFKRCKWKQFNKKKFLNTIDFWDKIGKSLCYIGEKRRRVNEWKGW